MRRKILNSFSALFAVRGMDLRDNLWWVQCCQQIAADAYNEGFQDAMKDELLEARKYQAFMQALDLTGGELSVLSQFAGCGGNPNVSTPEMFKTMGETTLRMVEKFLTEVQHARNERQRREEAEERDGHGSSVLEDGAAVDS